MSRFVRPQTRTLTLANGDHLIVRERLTAGEQRAHVARMYPTDAAGVPRRDPLMFRVAAVLAYLLDWNLRDDAGNAVLIRDLAAADLLQVLDSLETDSFDEIYDAIAAHDAAMTTEREQQKKTDGATPSSATSLSLVASGGATNG